jgi:hypothetical protein
MRNDVWKCVSLNIAKRNSWLMAGKSGGVRRCQHNNMAWENPSKVSLSLWGHSLLDVLLGMMADGTEAVGASSRKVYPMSDEEHFDFAFKNWVTIRMTRHHERRRSSCTGMPVSGRHEGQR